jgi:formate--tetrahydrofolate ligase
VAACERPSGFSPLTPPGTLIRDQVEAIARRLYRAEGVDFLPQAEGDLVRMELVGLGDAPVCMAKTHLSLSHDPALRNRPTGFRVPVRGLVPSAGAGYVVVLRGDMQLMPGLGRAPNFTGVDVDERGRTLGLL